MSYLHSCVLNIRTAFRRHFIGHQEERLEINQWEKKYTLLKKERGEGTGI